MLSDADVKKIGSVSGREKKSPNSFHWVETLIAPARPLKFSVYVGIKSTNVFYSAGINELQEKLYEFEQNKKNNLIFYGISNDVR